MRKLALIGAGALALAAALLVAGRQTDAQQTAAMPDSIAAPRLAAGDTARLLGLRQPIFFRHDIHAGQSKIPCQYCHNTVAVSSEPGIPSVQTCMGCHLVISGSDSGGKAEIKKLRQYWADRDSTSKPRLEWVRIHTLARHAHFPHMRHIKILGPNACQSCHGDVARMPQVYKVNNVNNMGFCITCHVDRKINRDCTACHY
jgi:cytochrome c7-like protein